ncbi:MAG: NADH-quinone oxidoreductase subunit J [Gemmatimonadota bacterium]
MIAEFFFLLLLVMAAAGAVMMVASRNPVASLMFLVLTLFAVAGLFVLLDAHFLAAVQVIVYAGAIMVLFLFVIMLLNLGHDSAPDLRGLVGRAVALVLGAALFAAAGTTVRGQFVPARPAERAAGEALLETRGAIAMIADPLFRDYLVPFEVTSLLLLVAVVGAIVLAGKRA